MSAPHFYVKGESKITHQSNDDATAMRRLHPTGSDMILASESTGGATIKRFQYK